MDTAPADDKRGMGQQTDVRKLLVLRGPALQAEGLVGFLSQHFQVEVVEQMGDALTAMRERPFTAVLAETADFLPLERGVVTQQASAILDTLGDGVCIIGATGELVWANRRARDLAADVRERLRGICSQAFEDLASTVNKDPQRGKRSSLVLEDGTYYEVICSPVRDGQGILRQVAAVIVDATFLRRQQRKLNAIDRAGRELVGLERGNKQDALQRLRMLAEKIIRCSRDVLNFKHFAVLLLHEDTNRLELVISEGLSSAAEQYELFAGVEGNGICGYVAATGRSYICPDISNDSRYLPGMIEGRSSLTVPLRLHDKVIGVLNVESDRLQAFAEEDRQFAEIFANHIALALHILNLMASERHTAQSQVSGSFSAELSGPLNDIITGATELMEEYIGYDDLRKRLSEMVDLAAAARKSVQRLTEVPGGVLAEPGEPLHADPILAGKSILVAEDEEQVRLTIRDALTACRCKVQEARDGVQARTMIRARTYDLVISDISMPGASGYDVFSEAKRASSSTHVVLITAFGYDPKHSIVRAKAEGLSAVLLKPFKVNDLLDACRTALLGTAH